MRIFISSTFVDLRAEREAAVEALRRSQLVPWGMELFLSEPSSPLEVCLCELRLSDAVVLIIGGQPSPKFLSMKDRSESLGDLFPQGFHWTSGIRSFAWCCGRNAESRTTR